MKPGTEVLLSEHLKQLKLTTILRQYPVLARQARENGSAYEDFLLSLIEAEMQARADNRLKRRIRDARFPLMKTMESFDYDAAPDLDRRLVKELVGGSYIQEHKNVIFVGKTGTGKTHLENLTPRSPDSRRTRLCSLLPGRITTALSSPGGSL
jgi:DNA replication protein DnaC